MNLRTLIRQALFEAHDPDNGHAQPVWHDHEPTEHRILANVKIDPDRLMAFHRWSAESYEDNEESSVWHDHGHVLRRPGEHPEEFYQRALDIATRSQKYAQGTPAIHCPTLESYAKVRNSWRCPNGTYVPSVMALNMNVEHDEDHGDDSTYYARHFLHPVHSS